MDLLLNSQYRSYRCRINDAIIVIHWISLNDEADILTEKKHRMTTMTTRLVICRPTTISTRHVACMDFFSLLLRNSRQTPTVDILFQYRSQKIWFASIKALNICKQMLEKVTFLPLLKNSAPEPNPLAWTSRILPDKTTCQVEFNLNSCWFKVVCMISLYEVVACRIRIILRSIEILDKHGVFLSTKIGVTPTSISTWSR